MPTQGWTGWDEYAPFYDWENARTLGRRDVPFWRRLAAASRGRVLELGCGTGRIALALARDGIDSVGVDRSAPMLAQASRRLAAFARRRPRRKPTLRLVRADVRQLPFPAHRFDTVLAPYGMLQSLLRDRDLVATLGAVARVLRRGGTFGIDLVPDVPRWKEYRRRIQLRGRAVGGAELVLVESVRQDRRRGLTFFDQEYRKRTGKRTTVHAFTLTFRTLPVERMIRMLRRAGFSIRSVVGDYRGRPWTETSDVWIILAEKV